MRRRDIDITGEAMHHIGHPVALARQAVVELPDARSRRRDSALDRNADRHGLDPGHGSMFF